MRTIFQACMDLDIDNLISGTGKIINIIDMVEQDDKFLDMQCTISEGSIFIGSIEYKKHTIKQYNKMNKTLQTSSKSPSEFASFALS